MASPEEAASLKQLVAAFAAARALYKRRRWREAKTAFDRILERWPADGPSQLFSRRSEEYLRNEPAADWDGVFVMKHK